MFLPKLFYPPAVIVSPDYFNAHLNTVVVVPLTTGRSYSFRVATRVVPD